MKLKAKTENWRTGEDGCGSYSCPAVLLSEHVPNNDGFQIAKHIVDRKCILSAQEYQLE